MPLKKKLGLAGHYLHVGLIPVMVEEDEDEVVLLHEDGLVHRPPRVHMCSKYGIFCHQLLLLSPLFLVLCLCLAAVQEEKERS
jgi:hypothetical protein